jgi:hypothetical protein
MSLPLHSPYPDSKIIWLLGTTLHQNATFSFMTFNIDVILNFVLIFFSFFLALTRVVVQNVGTRDPEGVPLGARMRNRVPPFFRVH